MRQLGRPLRHQRRLPLAPQRDEREHVRALRFAAVRLRPGIGQDLRLRLGPTSSAGAYLMMREMSAGTGADSAESWIPVVASNSAILAFASAISFFSWNFWSGPTAMASSA